MTASSGLAWRVVLVGCFLIACADAVRGESLHERIDRHLKPTAGFEPQRCSDAEFLRRASLDLIGMPPTADEARAFIADSAEDKRQRLIERLFASPHFVRHLANTLDLMLMERRAHTHVAADEWRDWLVKSIRENKPWNVLAREILSADGDDPAQRPAARFALDRSSEPNLLTRDIGRIFFGRDMQCAQCHDHPIVADYLQSDYQGLLAFVAPSYQVLRTEGDKQLTLQGERIGNDVTFESVFLKTPRRTGARMPDGTTLDEPFLLPGEEYVVAPAENVKAVPKFSRRAKLAELATSGSNDAFNRNIVNRLWAHLFGRGLVHPLDMHHPENPATDPELLQLLSKQFVAMNYDMRAFLRELALTEAYQRAFDAPQDVLAFAAQAAAELETLKQRRDALKLTAAESSKTYAETAEAWEEAEAAMMPVAGEFDAARTKYAEAKQNLDAAVQAAAEATAQLKMKQEVAGPLQQAATAAQQAVQIMAEDQELAGAAQLIAAKAQQVTAEIESLGKVAAEKTAAVPATTEAWKVAKPVLDETLTKVTPLTTTMKQAEETMLAARQTAEADAEALAAIDRKLEIVERVANLPELQAAIPAVQQLVPQREAELAAAQKQFDEYAPMMGQSEAAVISATEAITAAATALESAKTEHAKRTELAQAIRTALEATSAAAQRAPEDSALTEAVTKLQERVSAAQTAVAETEQQLAAATTAHQTASDALITAQKALADAAAELARREQAVNDAKSAIEATRGDVAAKQAELDGAIGELTDHWAKEFTLASLKPLSAEQLCWSVFRATGVYDRHWQAEVAELDKTSPLTDEQKHDPAQLATREAELELRTFNKLKDNINTFVSLYAAAAGQPQGDFFATPDQALFAANGGAINSWVAPAENNVTDRIIKQSDPRVAAEELYLSVLSRMPTDEEVKDVVDYLASRGEDRTAAAQELVWSLLNLAEFRFNH